MDHPTSELYKILTGNDSTEILDITDKGLGS
jgi:hypothetical protein